MFTTTVPIVFHRPPRQIPAEDLGGQHACGTSLGNVFIVAERPSDPASVLERYDAIALVIYKPKESVVPAMLRLIVRDSPDLVEVTRRIVHALRPSDLPVKPAVSVTSFGELAL